MWLMLNGFSVKERPLLLPTTPQRGFTFSSGVNAGPISRLLLAYAHNAEHHVQDIWQDNINLHLGKKNPCLLQSV